MRGGAALRVRDAPRLLDGPLLAAADRAAARAATLVLVAVLVVGLAPLVLFFFAAIAPSRGTAMVAGVSPGRRRGFFRSTSPGEAAGRPSPPARSPPPRRGCRR